MEQELNKKEQELNKKEKELANNKTKIIDLEYQNKLLKEKLDNLKESVDLKSNENNELKNIKKSYEGSCTSTKIPQIVRKKDDKARTFDPKDFKKDSLPKYNEKLNRFKNLEEEYQNITEEEYIPNPNKIPNIGKDRFIGPPTLEKLNLKYIEKAMENSKFYEHELNVSDSRIKYLDKIIKGNPQMSNKKIDIINQLKSLYTVRKNYFKVKINDPKSKTRNLRSLDDQIRKLEDEFRDQKGSGTFNYQNKFLKLLTLLPQLLTKNNSKKLKDDVNQMLKELYNSKQITKQVYNILNKSILYKNDS